MLLADDSELPLLEVRVDVVELERVVVPVLVRVSELELGRVLVVVERVFSPEL